MTMVKTKAGQSILITHDTDFFLGPTYLVTVHDGETRTIADMRHVCTRNDHILAETYGLGSGRYAYAGDWAMMAGAPLAGDSGLELYDYKHGVRAGPGGAAMLPSVEKLTIGDMIALSAYAGSLPP